MTTLTVNNLSIIRNKRILCRDLSFSITTGDRWAIIGPNGSGKTTLLHTLCGQLNAASGEIQLNQRCLTHFKRRDLAQHLGILFQEYAYHFPQIVRDYCLDARFPHHSLMSADKFSDKDTQHLQHIFANLQLTQLAEQNIQQLSGGEQRRVAIAALLMQAPHIYLLDEPTNHLDLHHQIKTMNFFTEQSATHGCMMAIHDINLAAHYCNKFLMLFPDGSTAQGHRDEILTAELLSHLYQHPIDVIQTGDQTYWQPKRTTLTERETPWEYVY